jgi:hypothetical protein
MIGNTMSVTAPELILRLRRILVGIAVSLVAIDLVWSPLAHFRLDYSGYMGLALLSLALLAGSWFYRIKRPDPGLSAMLFGAGFLCLFSAAASVLNYCLLTVAGTRIDSALAAIDRSLGFNWPDVMTALAPHTFLTAVLFASYNSILPQLALLLCVLGRGRSYVAIYRFCIAMSVGAIICIATWSVGPSFGAISVYEMPAAAANMELALDQNYAQILIGLLAHGPEFISPVDIKGLIGFPSYHAVLALLMIYYTWPQKALRWPVLLFNLLVLVATPIEGGHHLIDVLAAVPVTVLALFAAGELRGWFGATAIEATQDYAAPLARSL